MPVPRLPLLLVGALFLVSPLAAQGRDNPYLRPVDDDGAPHARRRGGAYVSAGLGAGGEAIADLGAPAPYTPSRIRPTLNFAIGGTVSQQLRLGFEGFAWFNLPDGGTLETVSAAMIGGRFYPAASSGFYLHAAGGIGRYGQDAIDDLCGCTEPITSDYGLAWSIGAGYETPLTRGIWLGPTVDLFRTNIAGPSGYRERVLNVGISVTFDGHD